MSILILWSVVLKFRIKCEQEAPEEKLLFKSAV